MKWILVSSIISMDLSIISRFKILAIVPYVRIRNLLERIRQNRTRRNLMPMKRVRETSSGYLPVGAAAIVPFGRMFGLNPKIGRNFLNICEYIIIKKLICTLNNVNKSVFAKRNVFKLCFWNQVVFEKLHCAVFDTIWFHDHNLKTLVAFVPIPQ